MRSPFMLDALTVVNELALRAVALVIVACFVANDVATFTPSIVTAATLMVELVVKAFCFAAIVVAMSTPLRYNGPASIMLDPMMAEPATSIDGALTGAENTALPAAIPNLSTPLLSAKLKVPDAGFTRAQVNSDICTIDEDVSVACFPASADVSPVTSAMATVVDCCA